MVPIEFSTASAPSESVHAMVLSTRESNVFIDHVEATDWIKLNPGSFGFYRVHYSSEMLQMLKPAISDCTLPPIDRLTLLDDLFALVCTFLYPVSIGSLMYLGFIHMFFMLLFHLSGSSWCVFQ